MEKGLDHCIDVPTAKYGVRLPARNTSKKYMTEHISAKVNMTGELNFILSGMDVGFILEFFYQKQGLLHPRVRGQYMILQSTRHLLLPSISVLLDITFSFV